MSLVLDMGQRITPLSPCSQANSPDKGLFFMHLNDIADDVHAIATAHGWWDDTPERPLRTFGDCIALIHSEVSEALEEFRNGHEPSEVYFSPDGKPEGIPIELADVIIRIADLAARHGMDLDEAVEIKMAYNDGRPMYHGGKKL